MEKTKVRVGKSLPRISYVPRRTSVVAVQIKEPTNDNSEHPSTSIKKECYQTYKPKRYITSAASTTPSLSLSNETSKETKKTKKSSNTEVKNWYKQLTPGKQTTVKGLVGALVVVGVVAAVMIPIYFFVIQSSSSETDYNSTTTTLSVCSSTSCIGKETPYATKTITALYPFDGNLNDISGYANGISYGFTTPATSIIGYVSSSITISANLNQYIQIPNIDFSQKSFTIQVWINPTGSISSGDYGLFSQCDRYNICLSLGIRNSRVVFSLDSMNSSQSTLTGSYVLGSGTGYWFHLTLVYDITLFQQRIYVNGRIDGISSGIISPFRGSISSLTVTTIGRGSSTTSGTTYFNGRIDHLTVSSGVVRTACEILNDASLVVYYPFDTIGTYNDYGANLCHGVAYAVDLISTGHTNQAISFASSNSYFQSQCFPRTRDYDSSYSYSLWIKPNTTINGGSIIHISTYANGSGYCYDALALTTSGNITVQWSSSSTSVTSVPGPVVSLNTWTHIAVILSKTNGIRLFIDGQFSTSATPVTTLPTYEPMTSAIYITLGNVGTLGSSGSTGCLSGASPIVSGAFQGSIDTFRLYNRELDSDEICMLANL